MAQRALMLRRHVWERRSFRAIRFIATTSINFETGSPEPTLKSWTRLVGMRANSFGVPFARSKSSAKLVWPRWTTSWMTTRRAKAKADISMPSCQPSILRLIDRPGALFTFFVSVHYAVARGIPSVRDSLDVPCGQGGSGLSAPGVGWNALTIGRRGGPGVRRPGLQRFNPGCPVRVSTGRQLDDADSQDLTDG